jgi:GMP synthase-like glutamine amidotransferase
MKIGILQCDDVLEKFQSRFGNYPDMIRQMFASQPGSFEFEVFDCRKQQYPDKFDDYDGFITTGSRHSVYEPLPWIQSLIEFVKRLDAKKIKFIGICFGHQIIAQALKQLVEKSDKGWAIGIAQNRVVRKMDWMSEYQTSLNILVSHQDQVLSLPKGATVIAESDFCPYFMLQWNAHFISIQGHPEWSNGYSGALINERRGIIPPERVNAGLFSLRLPPDNALFAQWLCDFLTA